MSLSCNGMALRRPTLLQPVDACSRAVEQGRALVGRIALAEPLERVPQHPIAAAQLVDREIRFEHAAIAAEATDRVLEVAPGRLRQLRAGRRHGSVLPAVAVHLHIEPTE